MKTSKLYIFFCLFGIVLIAVVTIVVSQRYDPTGRAGLAPYVGGACAILYLAAIIGYWFFKLIFRGYGSPDQEKIGDAALPGSFAILKNWRTLFASMADPEDTAARGIIAAQKRRVLLSFALTSVMVMILMVGAFFLNWGESGRLVWALVILLPVWFFAQIGILIVGRASWDRLMKGLGFRPLADPDGTLPFLQTEVVYQGTRKGFPAYVAFGGQGTAVFVEKKDAQFNADAKRWFGNLPRLEVWKDMKLDVSKDGIAIRRPVPGSFLWLYDLWLAENLAAWREKA
jgi:hypothetical protein